MHCGNNTCNGDEPVQTLKDDNGVEYEVPPKIMLKAILADKKEKEAKSIMTFGYIRDGVSIESFHKIKDAKSLWACYLSIVHNWMDEDLRAILYHDDLARSGS
ncbi:hypothetical protein Tco_0458731 [Tanacetum coccineum]